MIQSFHDFVSNDSDFAGKILRNTISDKEKQSEDITAQLHNHFFCVHAI